MKRGRRKKSDAKTDGLDARFDSFKLWLSEAACASEQREPKKGSCDAQEKQWASWIDDVRRRQAAHFVHRVEFLLEKYGCVSKKRSASGSGSGCVAGSPPRSRIRSLGRVQTRVVTEGDQEDVLSEDAPVLQADVLAETAEVAIPRLCARYDDLVLEHRALYDRILRFVTRPGNPEYCLARVYQGAQQCHLKPLAGQKFCARHNTNTLARQKHGIMGNTLDARDQHRRIMVQLRAELQRAEVKWYARDLFWDELQVLRSCDNEEDYTDDEWLGALTALDTFLRSRASLCTRLGLVAGMGPRGLRDRRSSEAQGRREYIGVVKKFRWYHYDVFQRVLADIAPTASAPERACERLFLEGLRRTSEYLLHRRFSFLHGRVDDFAYRGPQCYVHRGDAARMHLRPSPGLPIAPARGVARFPARARFIQCDVCKQRGKETWRRVDAETLEANSTYIWKLDDLHRVGEKMKAEHPRVPGVWPGDGINLSGTGVIIGWWEVGRKIYD